MAAQQLYEASHCLKNITSELKLCIVILGDKNVSQRKRDDMARNITKVILPVVMKVTDILNDTGKDIAPISSVKVICDRNERKKLLQTVDTTNERKSTDMQMLGSYISLSRAILTIHHRDKRAHHEYNNVLLASLPIPANGHQYTKPEALAVLLANGSRAAVKQMIKFKYYLVVNLPYIRCSNFTTKENQY